MAPRVYAPIYPTYISSSVTGGIVCARAYVQASSEEVARAAAEGLNAAARRVASLEGSLRARGREVEKLRRQVCVGCGGEV